MIQEKPYVYGQHWAPHDIRARELGSGKSRLETAEKHRIKFQVTPNIGVDDGIDAARLLIPRCWFDAEKCSVGLEALTFYRKAFNERMQTFTDKPLHDWTSHAADAFRGLAVRHKPPPVRPIEAEAAVTETRSLGRPPGPRRPTGVDALSPLDSSRAAFQPALPVYWACFQAPCHSAPAPALGHYDVTSLLGEGGMGQVWHGHGHPAQPPGRAEVRSRSRVPARRLRRRP